MEFERQRFEQQENNKSSLLPIISASLLLHIALGVWLLRSPLNINTPAPEVDHSTIKAKLVFFEPAPVVVPPDVVDQVEEQVIPETIPVEVETIEPEDVPIEVTQNDVAEATEVDKRDNLPALDMPDEPVSVSEQEQNINENSNLQFGIGTSRDLARQHMQGIQSQAVERMAQRQAKQHQKAKVSPDLQIPEFDHFTTEDEKFQQKVNVRVDCSSSLNKTLSVLSGITGGGLKCSEGPDLTPYLKKHLNKGPDAQQQHR